MKKTVLILCGGQSPEHKISIKSTKNILQAINREFYHIILVGIAQDGSWSWIENEQLGDEISPSKESLSITFGRKDFLSTQSQILPEINVVFPVLHGTNGEDGNIQGIFEMLGIPYISPNVLSSSASMDKDITKRLLKDAGLKVSDWELLTNKENFPNYDEISQKLGKTLYVKPANMGSSVGVSKVRNAEEWKLAVNEAFKYDKKVIVEEEIIGRELECAVMGNESPVTSEVGEVLGTGFYSFDEKYSSNSSTSVQIPANISANEYQKLQSVALQSYKALNCEVLTRVDMFLTENGDIYVNELNTIPGFTNISMYPKLWEVAGVSYADLIDKLIFYAEDRLKSKEVRSSL